MNASAGSLVARVTLYRALLALVVIMVLVAEAPTLLRFSAEEQRQFLGPLAVFGTTTELLALAIAHARTNQLRFTLRALALGSPAFRHRDLISLARLPAFVAFRATSVAALVALAITTPLVVNERPDPTVVARVLAFTAFVFAAGALPLYTAVRVAVTRALELAPIEVAGDVLSRAVPGDLSRRRVLVHFASAVALPLVTMAGGTALLALARVRDAADIGRAEAATALARGALAEAPGSMPSAGRSEALTRASALGFNGVVAAGAHPFSADRDAQGRIAVVAPLNETSHAVILVERRSFALSSPASLLFVVATLVAVGAWLGVALGRVIADDLVLATRHVQKLGTGTDPPPLARPARFAVIASIGHAGATLAERFRVFAEAQRRAIDARAAALRLRGLLFASVSHDLKTPLNAILGFCAIASAEPLNEQQLESIRIIERRGRELLALLEMILDAARVEAQRLKISRVHCAVGPVLEQALLRGNDLGPSEAMPVEVELAPDLPIVSWDDARVAQAIGFVLGHSKRLSPGGGVRLVARRLGETQVEIAIFEPSDAFDTDELARLLDASNAATAPRRLGGLALGLSLARSLAELHGGALEAERGEGGGIVFRFVLPCGV